jgi:hypothetical protein
MVDSILYESAITSDWPVWTPAMSGRSVAMCNVLISNTDPTNWAFSSSLGDFAGVYMGDSIYASPGRDNCRLVGAIDPLIDATKIYPNPFHNSFEIETDAITIVAVTVMDGMGRMIQRAGLDNGYARVDLGDRPSGIYFVNLLDEEGRVLKVKKLIRL